MLMPFRPRFLLGQEKCYLYSHICALPDDGGRHTYMYGIPSFYFFLGSKGPRLKGGYPVANAMWLVMKCHVVVGKGCCWLALCGVS